MTAAAFAQALTGFGFAIVAVGSLSSFPWILDSSAHDAVTPIVATLGAVVGAVLVRALSFTGPWALSLHRHTRPGLSCRVAIHAVPRRRRGS